MARAWTSQPVGGRTITAVKAIGVFNGSRRVCAMGLCGLLLTGCASEGGESGRSRQVSKGAIPLPQRALLDRQSEPGCALKVAPMDGGERKGKPSTPAAPAANAAGPVQEGLTGPQQSLATRIKLEYERN